MRLAWRICCYLLLSVVAFGTSACGSATESTGTAPNSPRTTTEQTTNPSDETIAAMTGVRLGATTDNLNAAGLERWVSDIVSGNMESLKKNCWMVPESYIRQRYLGADIVNRDSNGRYLAYDPAEISRTVATGSVGESFEGPVWADSKYSVTVTHVWERHDYICPQVKRKVAPGEVPLMADGYSSDDEYSLDYFRHTVKRLILLGQGNPISPEDDGIKVPLRCVDRSYIAPSTVVPNSRDGIDWKSLDPNNLERPDYSDRGYRGRYNMDSFDSVNHFYTGNMQFRVILSRYEGPCIDQISRYYPPATSTTPTR